ncbi:MAG TPA: hypothetical protein VJO33_08670 [Gemmatimonadaceae bacterium]|nr:hypothetical protein [Gemmatimonadaceae bacterium]
MEWFVKVFLKASLAWLALGVTLGGAMAAHPAWIVFKPVHAHMTVLGFVTMMIYGVAYHIIPRFAGHPLHSPRLAVAQWWVSNAGLATMATGFALRALGSMSVATGILAVGGVASACAAYCFVYNIWCTLDGPTHARQRRRGTLPILDEQPPKRPRALGSA